MSLAGQGLRKVTGGVLLFLLAGCGSNAVNVAGGQPASPTRSSSSPSAASPVAAPSSVVQKALADLATASAALRADFAWVNGALPAGGRISGDPAKIALFAKERAAAAGASNAGHSALTTARRAAKSRPSDCVVVRRERAAVYAELPNAQNALAAMQREASSALSSMRDAAAHRATLLAALANLRRLAQADPRVATQANVAGALALSYTASEQQSLTVAIQQALTAATASVDAAAFSARAVRAVAPYCG